MKERLRVRAAINGHSMEEVRVILRRAVCGIRGPELLRLSEELFGTEGGVDLVLPGRGSDRAAPPTFD